MNRGYVGPEKPFPCPECDRRFSRESDVIQHVRFHKRENHFCHECNKLFYCDYDLKLHHLRVHAPPKEEGDAPTQEERRGSRPSSVGKTSLTGTTPDFRTYQKQPYLCGVCGKRFTRNSKLRLHLRVHTGEKPYPCSVCGKRYASHSGVKLHARRSHGMKKEGVDS